MQKRFVVWSLTAGLLVSPLVSTVRAQPPGGGGFGGGGMRMRNNPKMRLSGLWRGISRLETGKTPLTKDQARRVVALVRPWGSRPKMSDADAQSLYLKINAVLTSQQKSQLDRGGPMNRRNGRGDDRPRGGFGGGRPPGGFGGRPPGGFGGPGGGGPGGPGGGGFDPQQMRAQMQKMQSFMKTMNPFYPPSKYSQIQSLPGRMKEGMNRRYQAGRATLTALSRKAT